MLFSLRFSQQYSGTEKRYGFSYRWHEQQRYGSLL
jgi:hypothetical protein